MHITFACLLCKISNELETPSLASVSLHLKSNTDNNSKKKPHGCSWFCCSAWRLLSAPLYIYHDATLITLAKTAQKITAVAGGKRKKKNRKERKKEGERKKKAKMRCVSQASPSELSIGLCVRISKRIDRCSRLMATGRFDGYDGKKKVQIGSQWTSNHVS